MSDKVKKLKEDICMFENEWASILSEIYRELIEEEETMKIILEKTKQLIKLNILLEKLKEFHFTCLRKISESLTELQKNISENKMNVCFKWNPDPSKSKCAQGALCEYVHFRSEGRALPRSYCHYWSANPEENRCTYGDECRFLHIA